MRAFAAEAQALDLNVVFEFALAPQARVERLRTFGIVIAVALEEAAPVVVSEITTGDHSECTNGRSRAFAIRRGAGVFAIAVVNESRSGPRGR